MPLCPKCVGGHLTACHTKKDNPVDILQFQEAISQAQESLRVQIALKQRLLEELESVSRQAQMSRDLQREKYARSKQLILREVERTLDRLWQQSEGRWLDLQFEMGGRAKDLQSQLGIEIRGLAELGNNLTRGQSSIRSLIELCKGVHLGSQHDSELRDLIQLKGQRIELGLGEEESKRIREFLLGLGKVTTTSGRDNPKRN